jgi:hypothetical protein
MDTFGLRLWMDAKDAIRKHQTRFLCGVTDSSDAEKRFLPRLWRGFFFTRAAVLWRSSQASLEGATLAVIPL